MKVAFFTDTFVPEVNGVANTLAKLSSYLERNSIDHAFFAPAYNYKNGMGEPDYLSQNKRVHRFSGIKVSVSPESCLAFPKAKMINDLCDAFDPDIVHVTTEFGIGYKGMKYATSRKLPLIMSHHTDYCKYLKYFDMSPLETVAEKYMKWFYGFSHKTLVPSKHTLKQLEDKGFKDLGIWTRGIDTNKFNAGHRSTRLREVLGIGKKFAFLYVGRLSPEKGLDVLMKSIAEINSLHPGKAAFVFTGDGPYAETIRRSGFENVIMTGFKRDRELSEIYASCDCYAFPSGTETFGNTALEAIASGLPVAGIDGGGVTDFLTHEYNALLATEGDQDSFTKNMISIMESEILRRRLSENGVITADTRDWDNIFNTLVEDYSTVIEKNAAYTRKRAS